MICDDCKNEKECDVNRVTWWSRIIFQTVENHSESNKNSLENKTESNQNKNESALTFTQKV